MSHFTRSETNETPPPSPPRPSTPHSIALLDSDHTESWDHTSLPIVNDIVTPPPFPPRTIRSYYDWMAQYSYFQLTYRPAHRVAIPMTLEHVETQLLHLVTDNQHIEDCVYCRICSRSEPNVVCCCIAETVLSIEYYENYSLHTYCPTCRHKQFFCCPVLLLEEFHQLSLD